ncbi:MAG: hypothetical protein H0T62_01010 [Parachlamydiaceae bacterium]|nr:hypothetical protein [Parachlamydiaceae bacterium]
MQSNLNTTSTTSTTGPLVSSVTSLPKVEEKGWIATAATWIANPVASVATWATKPNNPVYLERIKKIDASWGNLLMDLASFAVEKKLKSKDNCQNQENIQNISVLMAEVLLAMGSILGEENQVVESEDFAKLLITNLLDELYTHDLLKYDLGIESEDIQSKIIVDENVDNDGSALIESVDGDSQELDLISSQNGQMIVLSQRPYAGGVEELKTELKKLFNNFLLNIGFDEEHSKNRSDLLQWALYSKAFQTITGIPGKDDLEALFIEYGVELCKVQKRLELKSSEDILVQNEGVSEFADYLVEKQIESLQEDGLSLEFPFLTHKRNKEFLTSNINQVLLKGEGIEDEGSISWAWDVISNQIKMAIKAILAVVLTPKENETAEERRNNLLDGILNKLSGESQELLISYLERFNQMQRGGLCTHLLHFSKDENPYQLEAKKLFDRQSIDWLIEAQRFYKMAWHTNEELQTRDELLAVLNTWKEYSKTDELWIDSNSIEIKALLARESLTWEDEARNFLKVIIYDRIARKVLDEELNTDKFSAFFPSFFPANNVFHPLYKLIGEKSLELHEHLNRLEGKGDKARVYLIDANVTELIDFINGLLIGFITTIEEKASKGEEVIDLGYPFLNEMISHLLQKPKDGENVGIGKELAKAKVINVVEDILMTVLSKTIQKHCNVERGAVDVFPFLIGKMIEKAIEGFDDIKETVEFLRNDEYDIEFLQRAIGKFAKDLNVKVKLQNSKDQLIEQAKELLIKSLVRDLTSILLPQELFNSLLPPMFRKSKLWEMMGDNLIVPYISDIFEKVVIFKSAADHKSEAAKQYKLDEGIKEKVFPIIKAVVKKMKKGLSSIKFGKLLQSENKEKGQIDFSILDKFFGKALEKNGQIAHLIKDAVPHVIESIFAFHLNPKDEKTSEERATDLLWSLLNAANTCCGTIDAVKRAWDLIGEEDAEAKLENDTFFEETVTEDDLAAYRKEKKSDPLVEVSFKQCYIWVQTNQILNETVIVLMDQLVPEELWNERVPEQFRKFLTRAQVGSLLFDYLKDWNEFSAEMKELMHSGKEQVGKGDDLDDTAGFIENKVKDALADFCKPKAKDKPDELWMKEILNDLLIKEKSSSVKPVTNLAIKYAYAILGKLLSGRISDLSDSEILIKSLTESDLLEESAYSSENSSPLALKSNKLLPAVQESYHKLNALVNNIKSLTCRDFSQISDINLAIYLSAVQDPALLEKETIIGYSNSFIIEKDRIVLKVQIQDSESLKMREVSLDLYNFIYWELAYRSIDLFIPKEGWKELMPKFLRKVITKGFLATFAVPYVELAHKLQAPLQGNSEKGELLVDEVIAEERSKKRSLQALDLETHVLPLGSLHRKRDPLERPIRPLIRAEPRGPVNKHHKLEGLGLIDSKEHEKRLENIEKASTDLVAFIDVMVLDKINEFITDLANEDKSSSKKCEVQVLGSILSSPENALIGLKLLKEEDFFDPTYKAIFEAIREVFSEKKGLDLDLLIKKLKANVNFEHFDVEACIEDLAQYEEASDHFKAHCDDLKKLTLKRQKPLIAGFPDFINSLLREFLTTKVNVNIKQIRETLVKRAVYLIISEFLKPAEKDENGNVILSATKSSVVNIRQKLISILNEYHPKVSGNQHDIAQKIVDEILPKETWETIFTNKDEEFVTRESIIKMVEESFVNDTCKKIIDLQSKHIKAITIIEKLDKASGLQEGKFGGLAKVVGTICASIDSTIDEYSEKKGKIFDQPLLFNEIAKDLLRDETTSGIIKESAHALVNICVAQLFLVKKGESPEKKLLEVLARMIEAYDAQDLTKTAASWLKEVVPEKLRKALLPEFLHDVITHEFLAEAIFKEYMVQIDDVATKIQPLVDIDDSNVLKMQNYVKEKLVALKNVNSRDGLSGYGGFVNDLEKVFLEVLGGDYNSDGKLKDLGPFLIKILNANITQIMTQPNVVGILDSETFLSEALAAALPMLGSMDDAEGYVELTDDQLEDLTPTTLKKLGITLLQNEDENDEAFKARIRKWHFEVKSGEMLAEIMFPGKGASFLLVPEIAQEITWNNVVEALGNQVGRVTNKDSRILLAINLLGGGQEDEEVDLEDIAAYKDLEEHLIDNKNLVGKETIAEGLFKKRLKTKVMKEIDAYFATWSPWLAPITWLARMFTKIVVSMILYFGVSQQAWDFVSSAESDEKLRRMIWKFLSFTKAYHPKEVDSNELNKDLTTKVKKVMEDLNLLDNLQWFVGPRAAAVFKDQQVLSFLLPKEPEAE